VSEHGEDLDWQRVMAAVGDPQVMSTHLARRAVGVLLGDEKLRAAVDWYVRRREGSELARSVLWLLKPTAAAARCIEIYRSAAPVEHRRMAVELFRVVATAESLPLVGEFLDDPDPDIQAWGIGVLDQILFNRELSYDEDTEPYLLRAEQHSNPSVRTMAASIRGFLAGAED
jgi:hypothetical protein